MMSRLPGCLSPQPEEIFSSWFARLAYNHWLTPHQLYQHLTADQPLPPLLAHGLDQPAESLLNLLAQRTLTSPERIQQTLITSTTPYHQSRIPRRKDAWLLPTVQLNTHAPRAGLQYCPQCLALDGERPYFRQSWQLSFWVACLTCQRMLLDRCPVCQRPLSYLSISLIKWRNPPRLSTCWCCHTDLATVPALTASPDCLASQQHLLDQLAQSPLASQRHQPPYFLVLYQALHVLLSLARRGSLPYPPLSVDVLRGWPLNGRFEHLPVGVRSEWLHWTIRLLQTGVPYDQVHRLVYVRPRAHTGSPYPPDRINQYFRALLMDRSAEELKPLFGEHSPRKVVNG
ncbi:TniQ family protein [Spirosoma arcticum]